MKTPFFGFRFLIATLSFFLNEVAAQDIESIRKAKPAEFRGNISAGFNLYDIEGADARRSPFSWQLGGSATLVIKGWSLPFSFLVRDQKYSYSRPFNTAGISPRYRWLTLHAGWRNLHFSKYTLAGHAFKGGGIEIMPRKFRFSAMRGELRQNNFRRDTAIYGAFEQPHYRRMGFGGKIGLGTARNYVDFIVFKAKDHPNNKFGADAAYPFPGKENLIGGVKSGFLLFKKLSINLDAAASAITDNLSTPKYKLDTFSIKIPPIAEKMLTINSSTRASFAGEGDARLQLGRFYIGGGYAYINSLFRSLGSYNLQNDIERKNLLFGGSFGKKTAGSFGASLGLERNNLNGLRLNTSRRVIASGNGSLRAADWAVFSGSFSNFRASLESGFVELNDTFFQAQTSRTASFSPVFIKKSGSFSHNLSLSSSWSVFDLTQGPEEITVSTSKNRTVGAGYALRKMGEKRREKWYAGLNLNKTDTQTNTASSASKTARTTLGATFGKGFPGKKGRANFGISYGNQSQNGLRDGGIWRASLGANLFLSEKMSLNVRADLIKRQTSISRAFTELRGSAGFNYRFK